MTVLTTLLVHQACFTCPKVHVHLKTLARLHTLSGKTVNSARPGMPMTPCSCQGPACQWDGYRVMGTGMGTVRVRWVQYGYGTGSAGTVPVVRVTVPLYWYHCTGTTVLYSLYCTHCTALYCTHCTALYCTVLTVLVPTVLVPTVLVPTVLVPTTRIPGPPGPLPALAHPYWPTSPWLSDMPRERLYVLAAKCQIIQFN